MRFTDIVPGAEFHSGSRLVTESEIIEFAQRYDPQPFHIDAVAATATRWGGLISSGWMTCGIAMELAVRHVLKDSGSIGSPGVESLRWDKPVRPGDVLRLAISVLESKRSASGAVGVVRWRWSVLNQHDAQVLDLIATSLFDIKESDRAESSRVWPS